MNKTSLICAALAVIGIVGQSAAGELDDMIGKWKWTDYLIEITECDTNPSGAGICATVIDGPQNKGMEMIRSKISKKGENFEARIAHPATSEIYVTRMTYTAPSTWHMDGCTDSGVCAQGDFTRVE